MQLTKLHDPENGPLRVIGLMSGAGSNLRKILEHEHEFRAEHSLIGWYEPPYKVVAIFSDNHESNAAEIGADYNLPVIIRDKKSFYRARMKPLRDLETRLEFDEETVKALAPYNAKVAAYAGYMSIATKPLIDAFLGVNVHPADLSIVDEQGNKKYIGAHVVYDAIVAGEKYLRSTTHLIEKKVDYGKILMVSGPVEVEIESNIRKANSSLLSIIADFYQALLKKEGDWKIFPLTLQYIAEGRYAWDRAGKLYFDSKEIPFGLRIEEQKH